MNAGPARDADRARIEVNYAVARRGLPAAVSMRRWIAAALHSCGRDQGQLSVRLVGAREGRSLNRQYRGKDYATNVLSFPAEFPAGVVHALLGDLVLCAPVIAREAAEQGKLLRNHYAHLAVHGVLHLCGLEHETVAGARKMETMEQQILDLFDIPDPYRVL